MFRKDKGKKRDKYKEREKNYQRIQTAKKIVGKASQLAIGAGLVTGGLLATKKLTNAGYLPKLIGKANDPLVRRSRDALKSTMHEGATKSVSLLIPSALLGSTAIGADYLIDKRHDMPITKKVRKLSTGNFNMYLPNELQSSISFSEFKRGKDKVKRKKKKPGLLSTKNNSYGSYVSKGAAGLALGSGVLSGIAAAPVGLGLMVPAATIGALSAAPTGAVLGAATKGTRTFLQKKKILKKDKYGE